ncbi:hypothetical protein L3X38_001046 [Prunus dulcis]|uniref:Uncharacterized protein n=1 Tax=Prunus dulcis TaxID=3755 RepID=A0AAD4ZJJ3_PRUDU|nr:hypothetical protein L3X38_001046 [Prunus dulcis]
MKLRPLVLSLVICNYKELFIPISVNLGYKTEGLDSRNRFRFQFWQEKRRTVKWKRRVNKILETMPCAFLSSPENER